MHLHFSPLTIEQFLSEYWQQQPILIKGGIANFSNPVSPEELAGLATEPHIESRLISQGQRGWLAESGPFTDFDAYGQRQWSLVVQSVNHWVPSAQAFARLFDFIPQWRFDDVMVSFAAPDGGVGPHVDNYDVFICQGSGQRRWRVGAYGNCEEIIVHEKLRHVRPFDAIIDEVVSAGDILYIPPGFPHEGISLDSSMSFSVGYKATNTTELLSGLADYWIDFVDQPPLLSDKQRQHSRYGQIDNRDLMRLQDLLREAVDDKCKLSDFLGVYLSQSRSELDLGNDEYDYDEWITLFTSQPLSKLYGLKTLYLEETVEQGIFYVDGERQQLEVAAESLRLICDANTIRHSDINDDKLRRWLWQNTNRGYWYFAD